MATREEIDSGLEELFYEMGLGETIDCETFKHKIKSRLHSQGVAIRVDRELPENPYLEEAQTAWDRNDENSIGYHRYHGYRRSQEDMAGYVAVEPLIKEE